MFLFRFVGRAVRRLLAMALLVMIRGRRAVAVVAAIAVVVWIAAANLHRLPIPGGAFSTIVPSGSGSGAASAAPSKDLRVTRMGMSAEAVPSVDAYIKGLTTFDAKLMWGSLSEEAISAMRTRGGSLEALQAGLDNAKRQGGRYEDITMIGNYQLQDGGKYLFYVLSRRGFSGPDQLEQVYFVFTVNRDGKITRIE